MLGTQGRGHIQAAAHLKGLLSKRYLPGDCGQLGKADEVKVTGVCQVPLQVHPQDKIIKKTAKAPLLSGQREAQVQRTLNRREHDLIT